MAELAAQAGQATMIRQAPGRRAEPAPEQPRKHHCEQQNTDAFVDIRRGLVPAAVVIQADHPVAQAEQTEYHHSHQPVNKDTDQSITGRGVTPLHEARSRRKRSAKTSNIPIDLKRKFLLLHI